MERAYIMWGSGKIRDAQFTEKNLLILSNNSSSTSNCHSLRESCNRPSMYSIKKVLMKISMHKNIQFSIDYYCNFDPFSNQILYTTRAKKQNDPRHTTTSYWHWEFKIYRERIYEDSGFNREVADKAAPLDFVDFDMAAKNIGVGVVCTAIVRNRTGSSHLLQENDNFRHVFRIYFFRRRLLRHFWHHPPDFGSLDDLLFLFTPIFIIY